MQCENCAKSNSRLVDTWMGAGNKRTKELFLVHAGWGADKKAPDSVPGDERGCGSTRPRRSHGVDVLDGVDELRVRVAR